MGGGALSKSSDESWPNAAQQENKTKESASVFMVLGTNLLQDIKLGVEPRSIGWEAGTRTPIRRSRVCSLTIRRPPSKGVQTILASGTERPNWWLGGRLFSSL